MKLQGFYFKVVYRTGIKNLAPDGISRLDTNGHDKSDIDDDIPVFDLTKADAKAIDTFNEDAPSDK